VIDITKSNVILFLFFVIISPISLQADELKKGIPFLSARKFLIKQGWHPIIVDKGKYFVFSKTEKVILNAHIIELESCAMDRHLCIFNYKKDETCLRLLVEGLDIKEMHVYKWTYECPDAKK
jgi:hypothetical protein